MITLKLTNMGNVTKEMINPLIFNDNTSQVWKIESISKGYRNCTQAEIVWQYENEAEYLHIAQLKDLLDAYTGECKPITILNIPFLPYGRQDKPISNTTTFAQRTFTHLIDDLHFDRVVSYDVHGVCTIKNMHKLSAAPVIISLLEDNKYDMAVYPDGGAAERYYLNDFPSVSGIKKRDQMTGKIVDYYLQNEYRKADGEFVEVPIEGKKLLIVDDICDFGNTFIELTKLLKVHNPAQIDLYVTHGLFSGGFDKLKEVGITNFFYTNSLPKNEETGIKIV